MKPKNGQSSWRRRSARRSVPRAAGRIEPSRAIAQRHENAARLWPWLDGRPRIVGGCEPGPCDGQASTETHGNPFTFRKGHTRKTGGRLSTELLGGETIWRLLQRLPHGASMPSGIKIFGRGPGRVMFRMMPPSPDLAEHLRNLRTIAEAQAAVQRSRKPPLRVLRQVPKSV
jgi:hypothetical protein